MDSSFLQQFKSKEMIIQRFDSAGISEALQATQDIYEKQGGPLTNRY